MPLVFSMFTIKDNFAGLYLFSSLVACMFVLPLIPSSAALVSNKDMLHALLINYAQHKAQHGVSSDAVAFNTFP